jgi:hypothetical protein
VEVLLRELRVHHQPAHGRNHQGAIPP